MVDRKGAPLAATISAATVHDSRLLAEVVDSVVPVNVVVGGCGSGPESSMPTRATTTHDAGGSCAVSRGIEARIARRGLDSSEKLGRHRWVVEGTFSWLYRFRRLTICYERRADIHQAFLYLACSLTCCNYLLERLRFCDVSLCAWPRSRSIRMSAAASNEEQSENAP